jgi:hypothetical protein
VEESQALLQKVKANMASEPQAMEDSTEPIRARTRNQLVIQTKTAPRRDPGAAFFGCAEGALFLTRV